MHVPRCDSHAVAEEKQTYHGGLFHCFVVVALVYALLLLLGLLGLILFSPFLHRPGPLVPIGLVIYIIPYSRCTHTFHTHVLIHRFTCSIVGNLVCYLFGFSVVGDHSY